MREAQAAAQSVRCVGIHHGIVGPRAIFTLQGSEGGVTVAGRAHRVHHVGEPVQLVVSEGNVRAGRVIDGGEIAEGIIRIVSVALLGCPAVREPAIRIIPVAEDDGAGGIKLVGDAPVVIVFPGRHLPLAIAQIEEVASGGIDEGIGHHG